MWRCDVTVRIRSYPYWRKLTKLTLCPPQVTTKAVSLFFLSPFRPDSSGFEHVFVGETRGGRTVIGFHNWIQLYLQEKLGHIDYKGYTVSANSPQVMLMWRIRRIVFKHYKFLHRYKLAVLHWGFFSSTFFFQSPLTPFCFGLFAGLALATFLTHWCKTWHPALTLLLWIFKAECIMQEIGPQAELLM